MDARYLPDMMQLGISQLPESLMPQDSQNPVDAYDDSTVFWVDEEINSIMENDENITPSIEEFMRNLGP